jgi:quercetin dioxygenase-like cupin family protein
MEIRRAGSPSSGKGRAEWFTGTVRIDPLFSPPDAARMAGASVTFEPGARAAWRAHPIGQNPCRGTSAFHPTVELCGPSRV